MISKKVTQENYANTAKEKVVIAQQLRQYMNNLMTLKGKRKRSITNIKIGTTLSVGDSILKLNVFPAQP